MFGHTLQFAERALALFEELGNRWGIMGALCVMGQAYANRRQYTQGKLCLERALLIAEQFGHTFTVALLSSNLAEIARAEGDYPAAHRLLRIALKVYWDVGYTWLLPAPLRRLAQVYADQQDFERAVAILATIQPHLLPYGRTAHMAQALRAVLETKLEPDRFAAAWARGQERTLNALVTELLSELADNDRASHRQSTQIR